MIGEHVVRGNEIWELLILLCQLTERLCAEEFSKSDLLYLDELLHSFFSNYTVEFPETGLKRKAHFIQHYPQMIFRFGPLVKTPRFESKHSFFKSALELSKNRKKHLSVKAKKHQFWMYLDYSSKLDNQSIPQGIGANEVAIESFNEI